MKTEVPAKTQKAAYVPPTLQKQQLIEEVLGQGFGTHGIIPDGNT